MIPETRQRAAAVAALVLPIVAVGGAASLAVDQFPRGLLVLGCVVVALVAAWYGISRRRAARVVGVAIAALALCAAVLVPIVDGVNPVGALLVVAAAVAATAAARAAFRVHVPLRGAAAPSSPVLFFNPKSGGGKAERFSLASEARKRGIEPIELTPGTDLESLVRRAVADGADALAMAGGDGSQAVVAMVAAELGLPYACIPAGTRNHFALDLGVDRDDVVGALDAFVDGGERRVDLADVNGRVFVNNVSLGLYAEAVQRPEYRDAKLRTLLDTAPDALGPGATGPRLRWRGPGGHSHSSGAAILVSNNRYRLGRAVGSGTRPRIDDGLLGVTVASAPTEEGKRTRRPTRPWREWSAQEFEVEADGPVAAGIDGEAVTLEAPLRFRIKPGVLRVRIAPAHPGASPSAAMPEGALAALRALARIAGGHPPESPGDGGAAPAGIP